MKNIAIISTSLNSGGAERIAGLLSKELEKYYNVYLFLLSTEEIVYEYGGKIVDIGQSDAFYEYPIKIYKELYKIDVAISFLEIMNFANIRSRVKEKVIISERCVQSLIEPSLISQTVKIKRYYDFADEIVSCSEGVKYDLVHNYGVENNIKTIYNFIDKETILSESRKNLPDEVQDFLGGAEFFVNVGRLHPQKNHKRLISQFLYFHAVHQDKKLLILGSGELEAELVSYITKLGLDDSVRIIPYTKNPFSYVGRAKALILASHYEGLPNVILEAMTLGCPVIATDCLSGPRELLMDEPDYGKSLGQIEIGKRGILVCDDETEDDGRSRYMAKAMELLCSSESMVENFRKNDRVYMEQYTNSRIVEQWIQVIEGRGRKERTDILVKEEELLHRAGHIVIYGAGFVGRSMFLRLSKQYKIDGFVISRKKRGEEEFLGIPIYEISELNFSPEETAVIIGVSDNFQDDVMRALQKRGFMQYIFPYIEPLSYDYYMNARRLDIKLELQGWYRLYAGKDIDIDHPNTFNEKIQWLKLHDNNPIKTKLADKYAVRSYVAEKIGEQYLVPLLGIWSSFDEINFSELPNQFVLKCTHGNGTNMIIHNKSDMDYTEVRRKFNQWMDMNYAYMSGFETHYKGIVPQILAEKMLVIDGEDLRDYKVFVFHGKVKLIQVDIDRQHTHRRNLYTPEWRYIPVSILYPTAPDVIIEKPACLDELIHLAEILGEGFIHMRVDFYILKEQMFFGELAFTHGSGIEKFEPEEYGVEMGSWMKLPEYKYSSCIDENTTEDITFFAEKSI